MKKQIYNEIRITNANLKTYFNNSNLSLSWTTILKMPGAQNKSMRKPNTNTNIIYLTLEDIIAKFDYRIKQNDPTIFREYGHKMLKLHGAKWHYMLDRAKQLLKEQ